ncbi:hypothetical protein PLICRDRAFT_106728 [Plicaturopsis crispa FD-325 SS-3]|nr:hypothetical protein PLICRDRAFT_106728 [Plicaturopsis crispa FD-325 SS-3]
MKALVYRGETISHEEVPVPELLSATDAIVRMTKTTICGTDLHILKGDVPTCKPGTILGHEGVGVVEQLGSAVQGFKVGDNVIVSCITACGTCKFCLRGMPSHCLTGGWILGNTINGTQAEYVRIPHASSSLHPAPSNLPASALVMLSDILPTGYECGVLNARVQPGSRVAIVGCGPVGLAALLTAQLYSPSQILCIDTDPSRLAVAKKLGATHTLVSSGDQAEVVKRVMEVTGGDGVDAAIEAVGVPPTFELCTAIIAPGGVVANAGVHGKPVTLHLETLWSQNISITTRLVDARTTAMLLKMVEAGSLNAGALVTHEVPFVDGEKAYSVFGQAAVEKALKVVINF